MRRGELKVSRTVPVFSDEDAYYRYQESDPEGAREVAQAVYGIQMRQWAGWGIVAAAADYFKERPLSEEVKPIFMRLCPGSANLRGMI